MRGSANGTAPCARRPAGHGSLWISVSPSCSSCVTTSLQCDGFQRSSRVGSRDSRNRSPGIRSAAARRRCSRPSRRTARTMPPAPCPTPRRSAACSTSCSHRSSGPARHPPVGSSDARFGHVAQRNYSLSRTATLLALAPLALWRRGDKVGMQTPLYTAPLAPRLGGAKLRLWVLNALELHGSKAVIRIIVLPTTRVARKLACEVARRNVAPADGNILVRELAVRAHLSWSQTRNKYLIVLNGDAIVPSLRSAPLAADPDDFPFAVECAFLLRRFVSLLLGRSSIG